MIEEFSKVNELPKATIEVEESVVLHVKEEISNVEHCGLMRKKNIGKESIEIEEEDRVEENERLIERLCLFDSMSTLFENCEKDECEKEKVVALEKSEVMTGFANQVVALEKSEDSLKHPCTLTLMLGRTHIMELEDQEASIGKELILSHENSSMSPFLNPSLLSNEVFYVYLKLFLESYISLLEKVSIFIYFLKMLVLILSLENFSKKLFLTSFISNIFEGTSLIWKLELLPNFMFLPFKDIVEYVVNMCHLQDFYTLRFQGSSFISFFQRI
ncbi:hypothetical protein M9H77_35303 [Catharanthus roseus]|uniref:Uncharacterized protein n=1 Tax=Catharanthus roseus TaxID=4058 RepID=A0ACB9ZQJ2_CATRO|nr:hypothetical protein M9H77_35303 [Catharanthus roseus]